MKLEELGIMAELQGACDRVTPEVLARYTAKHLADMETTDVTLGKLHYEKTQILWVAAMLNQVDCQTFSANQVVAMNDIDETELKVKAFKAKLLADALREVFWAQVAIDIRCTGEDEMGVRKDWVIVKPKQRIPRMMQMLGGGIFDAD